MAEGIRVRHSRECRITKARAALKGTPAAEIAKAVAGVRCNCDPSYEAFIYLKKEDRKLRRSFGTQAEAKSWRTDALAASKRGQLRSPTATTVAAAAEALLAGMIDGSVPTRSGGRFKPSTIRSYDDALRLRIVPTLGDMRLSDVTVDDVQALVDRLNASGLSASTVSNTLDPLRTIYRRARRQVPVDPTEGLELRTPKGRRLRIAQPEEARRLLEALPEEDRAVWACALYAGLRRGELRALRVADLDMEAREIHVSRGWDQVEGEQEPKSDAGTRDVPIVGLLVPVLAAHLLATGRSGDALVFGPDGQQAFDPSTVRRRALAAWGWRQAANPRRGGSRTVLVKTRDDALEPVSLHECRHTFASVMIAAGCDPKTLSRIMGHSSITVTFDIYGKMLEKGLAEARERVDSYLARLDGGPHLRAVGS